MNNNINKEMKFCICNIMDNSQNNMESNTKTEIATLIKYCGMSVVGTTEDFSQSGAMQLILNKIA